MLEDGILGECWKMAYWVSVGSVDHLLTLIVVQLNNLWI